MEISCIVLCGGQSRRMGTNKALIKIDGVAIIERVIQELKKISKNIVVVVDKKEKYAQITKYEGVKIFEDENRDVGPVEGMRIGLKHIDKHSAFICACDMPFIQGDCVKELYGYKTNDIYCVVPRVNGKLHPLHGIYDKKAYGVLSDMVKTDKKRIVYLFDRAKTEIVEVCDCNLELSLTNVNNPEDLESIKKRGVVYG